MLMILINFMAITAIDLASAFLIAQLAPHMVARPVTARNDGAPAAV